MPGLLAALSTSVALVAAALDFSKGHFQQDGALIEKFADTNTMEDYDAATCSHSPFNAVASSQEHQQQHLSGQGRDGAERPLRKSIAPAATTTTTSNELNIFVLPHSHDDPGWVRTSDQYFDFFVNDIYTTAVEALYGNPHRKFQAVEMIYFSKWFEGASRQLQQKARTLVQKGQLQFAVGGWAMPDEATTDYPDIIETMTTGHQWLLDTFGEAARPRFGFQVDPFGASSSFAALSALMGFDGHIVARLNYFDKGWMQDNQKLEFVWRPDPDLYAARGAGAEIFTHIMDQYQYSSPGIPVQAQLDHLCALSNQTDCPGGGFFWDGDDSSPAWWWSEQQKLQGYSVYPAVNKSNVEFYSDFMVNSSLQRANWFASPNLLWCFGTDFQHFNASEMFYSMDQIVEYINDRNGKGDRYEGVKIQYGMLEDYFSAVHDWASNQPDSNQSTPNVQAGHDWSVRDEGDFLPYNTLNCAGASQNFSQTCSGNAGPQFKESWPQTWSGFFTSHIGLKVSMRRKSEQLRAAKSIIATAAYHGSKNTMLNGSLSSWTSTSNLRSSIGGLRGAIGLLTHHDSQTGTMGPGCGNGDTARARKAALDGAWKASDASSTPNYLMSAADVLQLPDDDVADSATCPFLPMGDPGNAGAIDADYEFRLEEGWRGLAPTVAAAAAALQGAPRMDAVGRLDMDASRLYTDLTESGTSTVTVFNPLGWTLHQWVPFTVPQGKYRVYRAHSDNTHRRTDPVLFDLMPNGALDCADSHREICAAAQKRRQPTARNAKSDEKSAIMYIRVKVPPLGTDTITVDYLGEETLVYGTQSVVNTSAAAAILKNAFFKITFNKDGYLATVRDLTTKTSVKLHQKLLAYTSFAAFANYSSASGWNLGYTGARSGSYLMHTDSATPAAISDAYDLPIISYVESQSGYVKEVRQSFSPTATQVWRLYGGHATTPDTNDMAAGFIDAHLSVGPLGGNREIITHFDTQGAINTNYARTGSTFTTDNNGLLNQQRTYSSSRALPDGSVTKVAPDSTYELALNYFPIVRSANIEETNPQATAPKKFSILAAQAGAVTSRTSGTIEVMLMRKSLQDDSKGACQVFNDTTGQYAAIPNDASEGTTCQGYSGMGTCRPDACPDYAIPMNISERVESRFWLLAGSPSSVDAREPMLAQVLNNPPLLFYGFTPPKEPTVAPLGIGNEFPATVHLLNLGVRVNTASTVSQGADATLPQLVLRVQNIAKESVTLDLSATGFCNLIDGSSLLTERSVNTVWPLSGAGALDRWTWDTVERADDTIDLNRLNSAPSHPSLPRNLTSAKSVSELEDVTGICSKSAWTLKKHDLRTFYITPRAVLP